MTETVSALIVDDDPEIRELLRDYLAGFGIVAECVGDGAAMRRAMSAARHDVVILDLMLPGEDGLALCRAIRADSDIPVIMLTARGEPSDRVVGLELGADDYVVKPFEPRELVARIHSLLRRARARAARLRLGRVRRDGFRWLAPQPRHPPDHRLGCRGGAAF